MAAAGGDGGELLANIEKERAEALDGVRGIEDEQLKRRVWGV